MASFIVTVDDCPDGERLDKYVTARNQELSRSHLKNGVLSILVNGQNAKLARTVRNGDTIRIEWENPVAVDIQPENIPLDIIYEDENVTLVQKQQGMVTHPAAGNWTGTLVHALLYHWQTLGNSWNSGESPDGYRPGIVHRLDKDTSGLLITARNSFAETKLHEAFHAHRVKKVYIAILCGIPKERRGSIKINLCRDPKNRQRFTWTDNPNKGKFSHTMYRVTKTYGNYSLVVLKLKTGRTHQLRVHMKYLGCPILGDPIYGKKEHIFPEATLMLHAKKLGITLPGQDSFSEFETPVPERFKNVILALRAMVKTAE